ncbi:MAG: hypothetical protein H0V62_15830 [Gammaproteobacteria bacterium]|nr:hypothetical protein [Gammaproteobacteria bacterium]
MLQLLEPLFARQINGSKPMAILFFGLQFIVVLPCKHQITSSTSRIQNLAFMISRRTSLWDTFLQRLIARFGHWSARAMLGRPDESLALFYFLRVNNIGDRINPTIVGAMSRRPTVWTGDRTRPHLLAAGSLMAGSNAQSRIWGTGVMHPDIGVGSPRREYVRALRGKLSVTALRAAGIPVGDVPLGDPGFFISTVVPRPVPAVRRYSLGLIPHYVDWNHPYVCALRQHEDVRVIDVTCQEADFISQVVSCKAIVSSALHGLVIAESYGIPNIWTALSGSVVGKGFKFHDWFSTARSPQKTPVQARSPRDLIQAGKDAALHDMSISSADMTSALRQIVDGGQIGITHTRDRKAYNTCRASPLPVFVISFNRSNCLRKSIDSYVNADRPVDIIIHDNGSDDEETLETLEEFGRSGLIVRKGRKIQNPDDLNSVDVTVQKFFENWSEPGRYAVSDCDIELPRGVTVLTIYDELLNRLPKIQCVGPMIKISDIPRQYLLRNRAINRHVAQFWHKQPQWIATSRGQIAYQLATIDTTFALHRAGERLCRLKKGARVYRPFQARHLDWYNVEDVLDVYRQSSAPSISHWWNQEAIRQDASELLEFEEFLDVDYDQTGKLSAVTRKTVDIA